MKIGFSIALLVLSLLSISSCTSVAVANKKPNVLIILVDDLGWADVGVYNPISQYSTPNMDKLAGQGLMFTNGYAASPVCSPTRASLLTGQHPTRLGTTDFFRDKSRKNRYRDGKFKPAAFIEQLPENGSTIASELSAIGYQTAFLGKWHLGQSEQQWPEYYGFDINIGGHTAGSPRGGYFSPYINPRMSSGPKGEYLTDRLTSEAITLLKGYAPHNAPFFMMMSYYSVHTPLQAPQAFVNKYNMKFADIEPNTEFEHIEQVWPNSTPRMNRVTQTHATYAAMVEKVDDNIGRLVNELERQNLREDTIVILLSDNGGLSTAEGLPTSNLPLNGGKGWLYEGGIRIPFVISVPGSASNGKVSAVPVTTMDIAATLYAILGVDKTRLPQLDGEDLQPLLMATNELNPRPLFFHYPHYSNQGGFPGAAVRLNQWKLIERFEDGNEQLFNLAKDKGEKQDLASLYPQKVTELRTLLHNWYREHDAKFLRANPALPQFGDPWKPAD